MTLVPWISWILDRVAIVFTGSTDDYINLISVDHRFTIQGGGANGTLITNAVGDYTYQPDGYVIPADAEGTWAVGLEGRTAEIEFLNEMVEFGANNPVAFVDTTVGTLGVGDPVARRQIIDPASCNACHGDLRIHGNLRTEIEYCVMCHNPWATDEGRRPGLDANTNPPATIDFKTMIHKIHAGVELENGYLVYGFGSSEHDYSGVVFPGRLSDCTTCHLEGTYELPLPSTNMPSVVNIAGVTVPQDFAIQGAEAAACTGCHDGDATLLHASLNSVVMDEFEAAESCSVCHDEGSIADVSEVHGE